MNYVTILVFKAVALILLMQIVFFQTIWADAASTNLLPASRNASQSLGDPDLPYPPTNPFPIDYGRYTLKVNIKQPVINIPAWNLGPCMVDGLGTACDNLQRNPNEPLYRGRYTCIKSSVRLTIVNLANPPMTYAELGVLIRAMDDYQHRYRMVQMDFGLSLEGTPVGTGSAKLDFGKDSANA